MLAINFNTKKCCFTSVYTSSSSSSSQHISVHCWTYASCMVFQVLLDAALLIHVGPAVFLIMSDHLAAGLPALLLPVLGLQCKTLWLHLSSSLRQIWPAHCYCSCAALLPISVTLVRWRTSSFFILSLREIPSIALSIDLCATFSRWIVSTVSVHVLQA